MHNLLSPLVQDSMLKWSQNLFNAAQSGDKDLAIATLKECQLALASIIFYVEEEGNRGT